MNRDDLDRRVGALRKAQELLSAFPEVAEALAPALHASYFLLDGHGHNFEDYLAAFRGTSLPFLGTFSSRAEFDAWLKTHFVPPPRGALQIVGERYSLGYARSSGQPLLFRVPPVEALRRPSGTEGQEQLWHALDRARAVLGSSSADVEGLHSAALALHFIHEAGCGREFAHFLAHLDEHLPPLRSFATREAAEAWLMSHPSPPDGACVQVGDEQFTVGYWPRSGLRSLLRYPTDEALDEVVEDEGR
ncbi:hypothetical protein [Pyxidicoccus sp. MSG2]|uniref:hypothetical protein n=1 Tax=Pyxidicoccus sp. MSG2 TaxID=2996790 RepID=UPI00226F0A45|nr:hypothetical protein [Pyxidicoccus sp. MSG2]MCY1023170.1 hypothetical protein [Pyxidicoccus sp. MSG2]